MADRRNTAMQHNPWKLATIGLALMGTTALGTGLTTAWMMQPPATATAQETAVTPPATVARMAPAAPAYSVTPAVQRTSAPPVTRVSTPVRPVSTAAADCGTNGDRVMRIAKPGLIGALIGGLAGTALGAGYGAYKTKNECGTVFNFSGGGSAPSYAGASPAPQGALSAGKGITVYNVR